MHAISVAPTHKKNIFDHCFLKFIKYFPRNLTSGLDDWSNRSKAIRSSLVKSVSNKSRLVNVSFFIMSPLFRCPQRTWIIRPNLLSSCFSLAKFLSAVNYPNNETDLRKGPFPKLVQIKTLAVFNDTGESFQSSIHRADKKWWTQGTHKKYTN